MEPLHQAPLKHPLSELKKYSDEELARHIGYFNAHSPDRILGELEFRRRMSAASEMRGWFATVISFLALVISIYALFTRN